MQAFTTINKASASYFKVNDWSVPLKKPALFQQKLLLCILSAYFKIKSQEEDNVRPEPFHFFSLSC